MLPALAATPFAAFAQGEQGPAQLSDEDRAKLAEIHELINLLAVELAKLSQGASGQFGLPAPLPMATPYSYTFFQVPYGSGPFAGSRLF